MIVFSGDINLDEFDLELTEKEKIKVLEYAKKYNLPAQVIMQSTKEAEISKKAYRSIGVRVDGNGNVFELPEIKLPYELTPEGAEEWIRKKYQEDPDYFEPYRVKERQEKAERERNDWKTRMIDPKTDPIRYHNTMDDLIRAFSDLPYFTDPDYFERIKEHYINEWNKIKLATINENSK